MELLWLEAETKAQSQAILEIIKPTAPHLAALWHQIRQTLKLVLADQQLDLSRKADYLNRLEHEWTVAQKRNLETIRDRGSDQRPE